jgi:hypothetical protein
MLLLALVGQGATSASADDQTILRSALRGHLMYLKNTSRVLAKLGRAADRKIDGRSPADPRFVSAVADLRAVAVTARASIRADRPTTDKGRQAQTLLLQAFATFARAANFYVKSYNAVLAGNVVRLRLSNDQWTLKHREGTALYKRAVALLESGR